MIQIIFWFIHGEYYTTHILCVGMYANKIYRSIDGIKRARVCTQELFHIRHNAVTTKSYQADTNSKATTQNRGHQPSVSTQHQHISNSKETR